MGVRMIPRSPSLRASVSHMFAPARGEGNEGKEIKDSLLLGILHGGPPFIHVLVAMVEKGAVDDSLGMEFLAESVQG